MAKGEVLEHLGDGLYRVSLKFGSEQVQEDLVEINTRIANLEILVPEGKLKLLQAKDAVKLKASAIDAQVPNYRNGEEGALDVIRGLQGELIELQAAVERHKSEVNKLIGERLSLLKLRGVLERIPVDEIRDVWCADYVTDMAGEVGIAEVNDEGSKTLLMQPAYNGEGGYVAERDGDLVPRAAQTGPQVYFNAAILPGVQKWQPRYRLGTLVAIDGDLCTVALDPAKSSAQALNINQLEVLKDIPVQYMDCDVVAFELDDRVLVRWFKSGPQVVGFESNPKPCVGNGILFCPGQVQSDGDRLYWGAPFESEEGLEINPPLGTALGSSPIWSISRRVEGSPVKMLKGLEYNYGLRNWIGTRGTRDILSWRGPASRVFDWYSSFGETATPLLPQYQFRWRRSSQVFWKLSILVDLESQLVDGFSKVCGASIYYDGEDPRLLVIGTKTEDWEPGGEYRAFSWDLNTKFELIGLPTQLHSIILPATGYPITDWYFNGEGNQAVCTLRNHKLSDEDPENYSVIYKAVYHVSNGFSFNAVWDSTSLPENEVSQYGQYYYKKIRKETAINGSCGAPKLGVSATDIANSVNNVTKPFDSIPIYYDYRGNELIAAFFNKPNVFVNNPSNRKFTKTTKDYPHPCAGQPRPGGGVYPSFLRVESTSKTEALSESSATHDSPYQVVDSNGLIICEAKHTYFQSLQKSVLIESEYVQWSSDCGSISIDDKSYLLQYSQNTITVNFSIIAIDVRSSFCVSYEEYTELVTQGSKAGVDYTLEAESNSQNTYEWHDVLVSETKNKHSSMMRTFLGSSIKNETEVKSEDYLDGSQRTERFDQNDFFVNTQIFYLPGCDDEKTINNVETDIKPRDPFFNLFVNFAGDSTCNTAGAVTGISASCFPDAPQPGDFGAFTYVSDIADPISEIIDRDGKDYIFHFLGLY